jgi:hypothetical protein
VKGKEDPSRESDEMVPSNVRRSWESLIPKSVRTGFPDFTNAHRSELIGMNRNLNDAYLVQVRSSFSARTESSGAITSPKYIFAIFAIFRLNECNAPESSNDFSSP